MKKFLFFASLLVLTLFITTSTTVYANDFVDNNDADGYGVYPTVLINAPSRLTISNADEFYEGTFDLSKSFLRDNFDDVYYLYSTISFYSEDDDYQNVALEMIPLPVGTDTIVGMRYQSYLNLPYHSTPNKYVFEWNDVCLSTTELESLSITSGDVFDCVFDLTVNYVDEINQFQQYNYNDYTSDILETHIDTSYIENNHIINNMIYISNMTFTIYADYVNIEGIIPVENASEIENSIIWHDGAFDKISTPSDLNIGSWLLTNINSFLQFEIYPNFTLAHLFWFVILVPLLIFLLKMFLGG